MNDQGGEDNDSNASWGEEEEREVELQEALWQQQIRQARIHLIRQRQDDLTAWTSILNRYVSHILDLQEANDCNLLIAKHTINKHNLFIAHDALVFYFTFQLNDATVNFLRSDPLPWRTEQLMDGDPRFMLILEQARNWAENLDFGGPGELNPQGGEPDSDSEAESSDGD